MDVYGYFDSANPFTISIAYFDIKQIFATS